MKNFSASTRNLKENLIEICTDYENNEREMQENPHSKFFYQKS